MNALSTQQKMLFGGVAAVVVVLLAVVGGLAATGRLAAGPTTTPTPSITPTPGPPITPIGHVTLTPSPTRKPWTPTPIPTNTRVGGREQANKAAIEAIGNSTTKVRGLTLNGELHYEYMTKGEMSQRLTLLPPVRAAAARADWDALMGALAFPYQPRLSGTLTDRVAALSGDLSNYFDVNESRIVLVSDRQTMDENERINFSHAYAHALQDQNFGLAGFLAGATTTDQRLARAALIEGDATLAMGIFTFNAVKDVDWDAQALRAQTFERTAVDAPAASTLQGEIDAFPYRQGVQFALTLYQAGTWSRINPLYRNPPASTEQILHPARLSDAPTPLYITDLSPWLGAEWGLLAQDTLGEYILGLHVRDALAPGQPVNRDKLKEQVALDAAAGWDGDVVQVYSAGDQRAWLWLTVWDSKAEAAQFLAAYHDVLRVKLGEDALEVVNEPLRVRMDGAKQIGYISQLDNSVLILWVPDEAQLNAFLGRFAGH